MTSYILTNAEAHLNKLNAAGIEWHNWDEKSVLISADAKQVEAALGAIGHQVEASEWEDIFLITFTYPRPQAAAASKKAEAPPTRPVSKIRPGSEQSRANYIKLTQARLNETVQAARKAFEKKRSELSSAQNQYVRAASINTARSQSGDEALLKRFSDEYGKLMALPQIEAVRFNAGEILVYTKTLQAVSTFADGVYNLGKFLIIIAPEPPAEGSYLYCYNLSRRVHGARENMNAPYVYDDGRLCPDDILEPLAELVGQMEYATAVELLLQFLESAGDDPLGSYVLRWPQVKADKPAGTN